MKFEKINVDKALLCFLFLHIFIWTLVPSISNVNLPLDTIEALAWGSNLDWGYNKHPPLSAWAVEFFYQIFGSQDWAYYFLSQIFVVLSFFIVFKFSEDFFESKILSLISVMLLEGIYFYNFTTPEFNVNVCQLPFWSLTVYYSWKSIKQSSNINWLLLGFFAALGFLSKYLFLYLLIAIDIFFIYYFITKRFDFKCLFSLLSFLVILIFHLVWLVENDYTTITYALSRTEMQNLSFLNEHVINPLIFIAKQFGILMPFFIMVLFIFPKFKINIKLKDKKLIFLLVINIVPIILMFLTSLFMGVKIRTMWMTPFYLFLGVLVLYIYKKYFDLKKIQFAFYIFLFFFLLSPILYYYISISQTNKRTDYPGKKISLLVQEKWDSNFKNEIGLVGGDEWQGGNLSYHLKSRPKWNNILESKNNNLPKNINGGFVLIGNPTILNKICSGVFFTINNSGICLSGIRK